VEVDLTVVCGCFEYFAVCVVVTAIVCCGDGGESCTFDFHQFLDECFASDVGDS
jgi:hypothetical protein